MILNHNRGGNLPDIVDFPTPPFAEETAIIFFTCSICRFCGRPLCIRGIVGGAPLRGSPYISSASLPTIISHVLDVQEDSHAAKP